MVNRRMVYMIKWGHQNENEIVVPGSLDYRTVGHWRPKLWEQQLKGCMELHYLMDKTLENWPEVTVEGRQRFRGCREEEDVKGKCLSSCMHAHYLYHPLSFMDICEPSLSSLHT